MSRIFAGRGLVGVNVNPSASDTETPLRVASLADEAGFDLIGVQDHPYIPDVLDTWTLLSVLAARTNKVLLMTDVANVPLRPPAMLAKAAASLQTLSNGRVILGLGAGAPGPGVAGLGGPKYASPGESVTAFDEALQVIRLLSRSDKQPVSFAGTHYSLTDALPSPTPATPVPLWIGAVGPRMLRLVGAHGDGWQAPASIFAPVSGTVVRQEIINEAAEAAGRDPSAIRRNYNMMGTISPNGQGVEKEGSPLMGPPQFWVDVVGRYTEELGFDSVLFSPVGEAPLAQTELFAEQVLPHVSR